MHSGLLWTELHLNTNVQVRKIGNGFGTLKREHFNIVVNPHWFQNGFVSTFLSQCRSGSRYRETNECGPGSMVRLWSSQKVHCFLKNIIHKDWCYRSVSTRLLGKSCFYFYGRRRIHNIESFQARSGYEDGSQISFWIRMECFFALSKSGTYVLFRFDILKFQISWFAIPAAHVWTVLGIFLLQVSITRRKLRMRKMDVFPEE